MLPRWSAYVALVTAVFSYLAWTAAASDDTGGVAVLTAVTATIFWISAMVLAAYAVQLGVKRYRDRDRH
jgi:uncharacterized membrane protein YhaH (DUF805 family)